MIKKVKDWLGIEGVNVQLEVDETFNLADKVLTGNYTITSQSEQYIDSVRLLLKERYTRGRRKSKLIDEYILGEKIIEIKERISRDETITHAFTMNFVPLKSPVELLGDKNFFYRGITGVAKLLKNAKSKYSLTIEVIVKGNKLRPYDTADLVAN